MLYCITLQFTKLGHVNNWVVVKIKSSLIFDAQFVTFCNVMIISDFRKVPKSTVWIWLDGSTWDYQNWARGQPNYLNARNIIMSWPANNVGTWNDAQGTNKGQIKGYVCQMNADPSKADAITVSGKKQFNNLNIADPTFGTINTHTIPDVFNDFAYIDEDESMSGVNTFQSSIKLSNKLTVSDNLHLRDSTVATGIDITWMHE